jgi:hypothetical protein
MLMIYAQINDFNFEILFFLTFFLYTPVRINIISVSVGTPQYSSYCTVFFKAGTNNLIFTEKNHFGSQENSEKLLGAFHIRL